MTIERLVKARDNQYKPDGCKEYRRLEKDYLNFDYEYTKTPEAIEALEDNDVDTSQYQTEENKKAEIEHEDVAIKARDGHVAICTNGACIEMRTAQKEYEEEQKQ